jgi:hypothetical protein
VRVASTRTPVWVKAILVVVGVGLPAWWLAALHNRVANEHRLEAIASEIAGRPVEVHCPGFLRSIGPDTLGGTVRFDADGSPADDTRLRKAPCAELDALAEGRRSTQLACVARSTSCGDDAQAVARAVDTLTHESFHMSGIADEAETECHSLHKLAWTAQQLGATAAQGAAMAVAQYDGTYQQMGDAYRGPCDRPA